MSTADSTKLQKENGQSLLQEESAQRMLLRKCLKEGEEEEHQMKQKQK